MKAIRKKYNEILYLPLIQGKCSFPTDFFDHFEEISVNNGFCQFRMEGCYQDAAIEALCSVFGQPSSYGCMDKGGDSSRRKSSLDKNEVH